MNDSIPVSLGGLSPPLNLLSHYYFHFRCWDSLSFPKTDGSIQFDQSDSAFIPHFLNFNGPLNCGLSSLPPLSACQIHPLSLYVFATFFSISFYVCQFHMVLPILNIHICKSPLLILFHSLLVYSQDQTTWYFVLSQFMLYQCILSCLEKGSIMLVSALVFYFPSSSLLWSVSRNIFIKF